LTRPGIQLNIGVLGDSKQVVIGGKGMIGDRVVKEVVNFWSRHLVSNRRSSLLLPNLLSIWYRAIEGSKYRRHPGTFAVLVGLSAKQRGVVT
jgi:hypothetical protein